MKSFNLYLDQLYFQPLPQPIIVSDGLQHTSKKTVQHHPHISLQGWDNDQVSCTLNRLSSNLVNEDMGNKSSIKNTVNIVCI